MCDFMVSQAYGGGGKRHLSRLPTIPVTYELRDLAGETIKGRFYEPEIQKVLKSDDENYDIERIKTRKRNGKIQYLVS